MIAEKGISKRFLSYIQSVDKTGGEKVLGPGQTFSARTQATIDSVTTQAKALDQQKGYSKIAHEVCLRNMLY